MRIKSITLKDFKGIKERTINFGEGNSVISGMNAVGKTTILTGHLWLWCDRDSKLRANPNIRPSNIVECVPMVTEIIDVNGTEIMVSKMQKMRKSKPDADGIQKISLSNSYLVNSVPKTERDFKAYFMELGVDFERFLYLSHTDALLRDTKKLRPTIMSLGKSKTDYEVAKETEGCANVAEMLKTYKFEEIEAMEKASRKKAEEMILSIPSQIVGLESAKFDADFAELELQKNALQEQISEIEKKLESNQSDEVAELNSQLMELEFKKNDIVRQVNAWIIEARKKIEIEIVNLEGKKREAANKLSLAELDQKHAEMGIRDANASLKRAQEMYPKYKAMQFDDTEMKKIQAEEIGQESFICPTCKRLWPEHQKEAEENFLESKKKRLEEQEEKKKIFEEKRKRNLEECTELGNTASEKFKTAKEALHKAKEDIDIIKDEITEISSNIVAKQQEIEKLPAEVDMTENTDYQAILKEISDKKIALASLSNVSEYQESLKSELRSKRSELAAVVAEIGKAENNVRIDQKIEELEKQKLEYGQQAANAERILDELDKLSRAKNELLAQEINSKFTGVRFRLFDFIKNGSYKEDCSPEVFDNGMWKTFESESNTSLVFRGKIAILEGLQKAYRTELPIFCDGAECNDTTSLSKIKCEHQLILLRVTDEPGLLVNTL